MFFISLLHFTAFPEKKNAILANNKDLAKVEASGSLGLFIRDKCVKTQPNQTLVGERNLDWCSNIATDSSNMPWITFSLKGKSMKLSGFSLRNGCCWYYCCCDETGKVMNDVYCCCDLYSFSLLGSNDNITWTTIYQVKEDVHFYHCLFKTYEFPMTQSFRYIRIYQDQEYPKCPKCMQLNQVEFYGETVDSFYVDGIDNDETDESVSIIGKVKRSNE